MVPPPADCPRAAGSRPTGSPSNPSPASSTSSPPSAIRSGFGQDTTSTAPSPTRWSAPASGYAIVQPWSVAFDLDSNHEPLQKQLGFVACYLKEFAAGGHITIDPVFDAYGPDQKPSKYPYHWHSGFAWAARREALDAVGGLIDWAVLGSADRHMANCLIGRGREALPAGLHPHYLELLDLWQQNAERAIRRDIGCVPGTIAHAWHGPKAGRQYYDRAKILTRFRFDPIADLVHDTQGLIQLVDDGSARMVGLRDAIRSYFRARQEDSITT
jgi:hypothetical protein